jgi:hypothetical protein
MGARIVVRYEDGTVSEFNPNKPRLLLDLEKRFGVQVPERHEHVFWMAHHAVGGSEPFDDWVDRVEEVETQDDGEPAAEGGDEGKGQS